MLHQNTIFLKRIKYWFEMNDDIHSFSLALTTSPWYKTARAPDEVQ